MLTGDLVRSRLFQRNNELQIEWLDETNRHWQQTAADLIQLLQQHVGQPQEAWQGALERYEAGRTDYMTIRGLAKVLSDEATFQPITTPVEPAELRKRLFSRGPAFTTADPLQPQTRDKVLREAAVEYNITPGQVEHILYADRTAAYLLTAAGPTWTPAALADFPLPCD